MSQSLSQQRRIGVEAILTRIAADPTFRLQLQADPSRALSSADSSAALEYVEVVGYCKVTCPYTCRVTRIRK